MEQCGHAHAHGGDQQAPPVAVALYDACGEEVTRHFLGRLPRNESIAVDVGERLAKARRGLPRVTGTGAVV